MKLILKLFLLVFPLSLSATPQDPETLIYQNDTLYIDYRPLEKLREENIDLSSKLEKLFPWQTSTCWRGYQGTWRIVNDSLYLVKIEKDRYDNEEVKEFDLSILFNKDQISPNGVFAFWYSENISARYGDFLDTSESYSEWEPSYYIYSGNFYCLIKEGIVSNVQIYMKPQAEINKILKARDIRQDTIVYAFATKMPTFIFDSTLYQNEEEFIQKNIRYPNNSSDCKGKVWVKVIIDKNGDASNPQIMRGLSQDLDNEALRIVSLMKDWKPGKIRDKVVRVQYIIPVEFKIK